MPLEHIDVVRRTNTTLDVLLEAVLTIIGTLMVTGNYRNLGPVSHSSQCWMKSLQMHTRGPGGVLPNLRQHPGPITYDQKCSEVCRTAVNKTNNGIWLWKSLNPTILEIWTESLSAIWMAWSSRCWSEPWTSFTQFTMLNGKPPDGCAWSGRAADKTSSNIKARSFLARDLVRNDERSSTKRKAAMGHWNVQARQCKKFDLFHRSANWVMWSYSSCAKPYQKYNVLTVFFIGIKELCTALADNAWLTANPEESFTNYDWMHSLSRTMW